MIYHPNNKQSKKKKKKNWRKKKNLVVSQFACLITADSTTAWFLLCQWLVAAVATWNGRGHSPDSPSCSLSSLTWSSCPFAHSTLHHHYFQVHTYTKSQSKQLIHDVSSTQKPTSVRVILQKKKQKKKIYILYSARLSCIWSNSISSVLILRCISETIEWRENKSAQNGYKKKTH